MTIDEFNNFGWSGNMACTHDGEVRKIISVDFVEKLIAFETEDNDQLSWVRCENVSGVERVLN